MKESFRQIPYYALILIAVVNFAACGASGGDTTSVISGPAPRIPASPSNVAGVAGNQQVTLTWNAVTGATSYNAYWSLAPGVTKTTGTKISSVTNTTLLHTGLSNGTIYYYVVTAVNVYGESAESAQISAQPNNAPPPPPA